VITRIDRFVDWFVCSAYLHTWASESVAAGGYSREADQRERYERCATAVEHGADGSTHYEVIQDWREAFSGWIRDRRRGRRSAFPTRFEAAVLARFDATEAWHERHGSLHQEIG
jgi:hypothetical protein